jgi:hypothetical protein
MASPAPSTRLSTGKPVANPLPRTIRGVLFILFWAWLVFLPGNYLVRLLGDVSWLSRWWFLSTGALSLAAWVHWSWRKNSRRSRFGLGIALGITLAFLADVNGVLPASWQFADTLAINMALFALGHVVYIMAAWSVAGPLRLRKPAVWITSLAVWLLVGTVGWYAAAFGATRLVDFRWPALAYTLLLATSAGAMTALAVQQRRFAAMALGAALFLASDVILATCLFRGAPGWANDLAWLTYGVGEMLIVFGAVGASAILPSPKASLYAELT